MSRRAEYRAALVLCVAGAALLLLAAGQDWGVRADEQDGSVGAFFDALESGLQETLVRTLGVAALAGVVAVAATKRRGRQVVGAVLLLVGLYAAGFAHDATTPGARERATRWPWVAVVGGGLVAAGGLLVAVRGARWAEMSSRYDGPQNSPQQAEVEGEAGFWDAQSRGEDPT